MVLPYFRKFDHLKIKNTPPQYKKQFYLTTYTLKINKVGLHRH